MTTTYMNLTLPTVQSTAGPQYASDVNTALTTVDSHDHTTGKGTRIPTAGININADLEFNSFNQTEIRASKYDNQGAVLTGGTDIRCLYVSGGELYYRDNVGNNVKVTNAGAVNVSGSNGIGGDYGGGNPASLNFIEATSTYVFYENTSGPSYASIDFQGFTNRGAQIQTSTAVSSSPYTVVSTDSVLLVDTTSARTITLPNAATAKRILIVKDATGTSQTNNITLDRAAGGNIDGSASNKILSKNFGIWVLISDGTNWFVLKDELQDKTSVTFFDGSTTLGTDAIATGAFASPTLSAAAFTEGTAVSRSTNDLTFPFTGKYRVEMMLPYLLSGGGGSRDVVIRIRNTTDGTTSDKASLIAPNGTAGLGYAILDVNVTDIAKIYQVQWMASGTATVGNSTVGGETGPRWRIAITRLKDT